MPEPGSEWPGETGALPTLVLTGLRWLVTQQPRDSPANPPSCGGRAVCMPVSKQDGRVRSELLVQA